MSNLLEKVIWYFISQKHFVSNILSFNLFFIFLFLFSCGYKIIYENVCKVKSVPKFKPTDCWFAVKQEIVHQALCGSKWQIQRKLWRNSKVWPSFWFSQIKHFWDYKHYFNMNKKHLNHLKKRNFRRLVKYVAASNIFYIVLIRRM